MNFEMIVAALLFIFSLILLFKNYKIGFYVLMVLSVLLHKELFSTFRWDLLPIRLFMLAFLVFSGLSFVIWLWKKRDFKAVLEKLSDPFILLLLLLWIIRAVSLINSKNMASSIFLLGFFTTVAALGIYMHLRFENSFAEIIKYIKFYIFVAFGLCLFGLVQLFAYTKYGLIFGALWNVPGHLPRIGSLFWDVNHFGGLLAGLLPVLGIFILISKTWKERIIYAVMFLPMAFVLLITNSRTSYISAIAAFLTFVTVIIVRKIGAKGVSLVLLFLILMSIPVLREYSIKSSPFRAEIKQYFHYRIDSFESHIMLLTGSVQIFEEYPYIGGGYGSFFEHFSKTPISAAFFSRDPAALSVRVPAHTIWGETFAETGLVGILLFSAFVVLGLLPLLYISMVHKDKREFLTAAAMFSSLVGLFSAGIFYSYNSEFFWIMLFLYFLYGIHTLGRGWLSKSLSYFMKFDSIPMVILLVLAGILVFINLGKNHLLPWDEAIYAQISKNMVINNEYISMEWAPGKIWYEKPPLGMWFMALSFRILGVSEFAARLPSALFGIGTVLIAYFFGKKLFNKTAGFIGAFALLTTFNFLYYSRASMLDVTAAFFITLSLYLYWLHKNSSKPARLTFVGAALAMGAAVMVKGVIGFVPFVVIILYEIYLLISKQQKLSRKLFARLAGFFLISAVVFLPWHLEMYRRYGSAFLTNYIGYHVLDRATSAIEDKGRPFWWYVIVAKVSMRIWFIAFIPALLMFARAVWKKSNNHVFAVLWSLFIFALFSVSISKLKWYIVPLYPVLCLMVGAFIERALDFIMRKVKMVNPVIVKTAVVYLLIGFGLFYLFMNRQLVYESDLTGSQAILMQEKDRIFGTDTKLYADRIELPLILYYSGSPFEIVDFGPLEDRVKDVKPDEKMLFITKESRYRKLKEDYPRITFVEGKNEWVLAFLSYKYDYDPSTEKVNLSNNTIF